MSSRSLTEVSLLKKGLNFAVTPADTPATDCYVIYTGPPWIPAFELNGLPCLNKVFTLLTEIIAKVESAVRQLDAERADTVRRAVNTILQQAEPPKPNIKKEQQDALKSLKQGKSIMVLLADKGRASVVMDADTYHAKMSALIDSGPYQLLNKNPTDRLTRKLSEKLLTLKRNEQNEQSSRIYGLPKIHKANTPLRRQHLCI